MQRYKSLQIINSNYNKPPHRNEEQMNLNWTNLYDKMYSKNQNSTTNERIDTC